MPQYDLNSAEFVRNPYPIYDELRANDSIYWSEENNYWIITRYAEVAAQMQNPALSSNRLVAY
jgi:pimeloyl-[acyl-carrier protein] synthase